MKMFVDRFRVFCRDTFRLCEFFDTGALHRFDRTEADLVGFLCAGIFVRLFFKG